MAFIVFVKVPRESYRVKVNVMLSSLGCNEMDCLHETYMILTKDKMLSELGFSPSIGAVGMILAWVFMGVLVFTPIIQMRIILIC